VGNQPGECEYTCIMQTCLFATNRSFKWFNFQCHETFREPIKNSCVVSSASLAFVELHLGDHEANETFHLRVSEFDTSKLLGNLRLFL